MKKQSLRQFSLSDTLYIPQGSEALLKTLPQRVKEPLAQKIREACATLARAGHWQEVEAMLTEIVKPGPPWVATYKPSSSALSGDVELIAHEEHIPTQQKWALSLGAWVQYIEHRKQAVFATLPFLFTLDCPFFLGQRWIQEVIGQCQRQGDKTQMTRLFFGTAKRGTGSSVPAIIEEFRRDLRIADAVDRLVESGCRKQEAYRQVGAQFHLSENAVQAIYRKRRQFGYDPLAALLSPPQPTTEIPI